MPTIRPPFVPFDEHRAVRIYRRNLPHWRQDGVTYFVTFRLADSIPEFVRSEWESEKILWLKAHGVTYDGEKGNWQTAFERLAFSERQAFHEHFDQRVQSCLDRGLGECHLHTPACVEIVRSRFLNGDGVRYHLGDFVIMPNHVHLLITPTPGEELENILKRIKGASAVECNRRLARSGPFWQTDSYDHIVRSIEELQHFQEYIADNPAKAGIVVSEGARFVAEWMLT